jgi:ABC-2 type transport system permease protein
VDGRHQTLISAGLNALTLITGFAVFAASARRWPSKSVWSSLATTSPPLSPPRARPSPSCPAITAVVLLAFWRPGLAGWLAILAAFTVIALT